MEQEAWMHSRSEDDDVSQRQMTDEASRQHAAVSCDGFVVSTCKREVFNDHWSNFGRMPSSGQQ